MAETINIDPAMETVHRLRLLTQRTGALHEVQLLNLKNWMYITFPFVEEFEILFDPDRGKLTYKAHKLTPTSNLDGLGKRFKILSSWVQTLIGAQYDVCLDVSGITLYRQPGQKEETECDHTEKSESSFADVVEFSMPANQDPGEKVKRKLKSS